MKKKFLCSIDLILIIILLYFRKWFLLPGIIKSNLNTEWKRNVRFVVFFNSVNIRYISMSLRGLSYYEQHFFLTNRLVQLLIGLRPSQSSHEQLLLVSVVTLYVLPAIVHQVNVPISIFRISVYYFIIVI